LTNAPTVTVWGTGNPCREFLYSDDLADACVFLMKHYSDIGFVNVGTGEDITIGEFAAEIARVVGYTGRIIFDTSRPDGPPRKLLDVSKLRKLCWEHKTQLHDGLTQTYADFLAAGGRGKT
jgi:GDP-L-fucose synthase